MTALHHSWSDALDKAAERLAQGSTAEARLNAEYLALAVMGQWERSALRAQLGREISVAELEAFDQLIERRLLREPLQYIIGEWEFFGLRFFTTPAALIPRPETELLVEEILAEATQREGSITLLDIGTGSGAIPIAAARNDSRFRAIGIDISPDAIELAERNRMRLGVENASFQIADVFDSALIELFRGKIDILVSNPPYIGVSEFHTLEPELRLFEPRIALTDEGDGLRFYSRIAAIAPVILAPDGIVLLELGYDSLDPVTAIFQDAGFEIIKIVPDLAGIPRVFVAKLPKPYPINV